MFEGPIIRINPREIHINDPEFYETIYSTTSPFDKVLEHELWANTGSSLQSTVHHAQHRLRRSAHNRFFSKRQISTFVPGIQALANKLCTKLNEEYKGKGRVLVLNEALGCYTADVITEYAFAKAYNYVDYPDFQAPFVMTMQKLTRAMHVLMLFPLVPKIVNLLPHSLLKKVSPDMSEVFDFMKVSYT